MHDLASNNSIVMVHVEGSETEDTSLLQCFAGLFSQSQLPAVHLRLRGLLLPMYTMNNHIYNAMRFCDSRTYKALYLSCLQAKDTAQSLWETLVSLLKNWCCHKKCCAWTRGMCCSLVYSKAVANYGLHRTVKVACSSV